MAWRFETSGYFIAYNLLGWLKEFDFFPADPNFAIDRIERNANGNYELLVCHADRDQAMLAFLFMDSDEVHVTEVPDCIVGE